MDHASRASCHIPASDMSGDKLACGSLAAVNATLTTLHSRRASRFSIAAGSCRLMLRRSLAELSETVLFYRSEPRQRDCFSRVAALTSAMTARPSARIVTSSARHHADVHPNRPPCASGQLYAARLGRAVRVSRGCRDAVPQLPAQGGCRRVPVPDTRGAVHPNSDKPRAHQWRAARKAACDRW